MAEHPHQPCPFVKCASSDAFSWNDDGYGKCHSCGESYPERGMSKVFDWASEKYPTKNKTREPGFWEIEPSSADFNNPRGLEEDVAKLYGIQSQYDEKGNLFRLALKWPQTVQYRKVSDEQEGPKYRNKPGGGSFSNDLGGPDFNSGSSKRLYITEGMIDAASLYQALGKTYPVRAIPSGSIGKEFLTKSGKKNYKYLNAFQEIVYAGELDAAGKAAADFLYEAFPDKFYYVPLSKHKDANEFLVNNDESDLKWAALKPQRYTRFFEMGLLDNSDGGVALLHMEEMKSTTYRAMATYRLGVNVRTKDDARDNGVSEEDVIKAGKEAAKGERTLIFEMRAHDDPMKVLEYVRLAASVYGAEYVFIDHVQRLAYLSSSGVDGATSTLTSLGSQMAQLAKELNIGVIFISQVNDDGRTKYAAALEEEAIICIQISRDVDSEDEVERNTTKFYIDKNRPFAKLGDAGSVFYDPETTVLREDF